jgi:hypothetical protein
MLKLYFRKSDPSDLRELDLATFGNNPKKEQWQLAPARPSADAVWSNGEWIIPQAPAYSAEAWLEHEGYGAMRLLGLLDLEVQFMQAGAIPPKMQAVRAWINTIRAGYSAERSDWPNAPHTFEQTMQEATTWLTN